MQDGPGPIIEGHSVCSVMRFYCPEILVPPGFNVKAPPPPPGNPQILKNYNFVHILDLNLKCYYCTIFLALVVKITNLMRVKEYFRMYRWLSMPMALRYSHQAWGIFYL